MDYPLESLDPEQFQRVCQALILREFPSARFFPLGQADGGRDGVVVRGDSDFVVFQVKFVREPKSGRDNARQRLARQIRDELPRIRELADRGATHYRLITNLRGTGALGTGTIDRLASVLGDLPLTADAWWRDDLLTRLDDAWDLKWRFPTLLTGPDLVRTLLQAGLREDRDRRISALRAFLSEEYHADETVKFKQAGLENGLFELFVDLPLRVSTGPTASRSQVVLASMELANTPGTDLIAGGSALRLRTQPGRRMAAHAPAAGFLLNHGRLPKPQPVVIEGAPGQGKSTVSQYVCQIHRLRLLKNIEIQEALPATHMKSALRIPFRVDLRHFAAWVHGRNPFGDTLPREIGRRSLESFLAAQIETASGGSRFTVADLHAVARAGSLFVALDGLDEVADTEEREKVVSEASAGVRRLIEVSLSTQVIVTSRPAAFENSPGFDRKEFVYLDLSQLTPPVRNQYAERWIRARRLDRRSAATVRTTLNKKLTEPHIRELARNPMQLAILMTLVHQKDVALPDKRTALYDDYVNLFFAREAEKTREVAQHRDLLIEIHQYLAWRLQAEVEKGHSQGIIGAEDLRALLRDYLRKDEKDESLVDVLFKGMIERVVAIVSRLQGTYEFEVQPLREYFAARFLYDTAAHSAAGKERRGDITDRFDALARNFYWLNVARFFAGCYGKGELLALVDQLEELQGDPLVARSDQVRSLGHLLLTDWVFAQHPKSMKAVVGLTLSNFPARPLARNGDSFRLPEHNGRDQLIEHCWAVWSEELPEDRDRAVASVLVANQDEEQLDARWLRYVQDPSVDRTTALRRGLLLGCLARCPKAIAAALLEDETGHRNLARLKSYVLAGQGAIYFRDRRASAFALSAILAGDVSTSGEPKSPVEALAQVRDVVLAEETQADDLAWWFSDRTGPGETAPGSPVGVSYAVRTIHNLVRRTNAETWYRSLEPWNSVVETVRRLDADGWLAHELSVAAAGIRSSSERGKMGKSVLDNDVPLCEQARYARLRAGSKNWWSGQLQRASSRVQELWLLALFASWASPSAMGASGAAFEALLETLDDRELTWISRAIQRARLVRMETAPEPAASDVMNLPFNPSPRFVSLLMIRNATIESDLTLLDGHMTDVFTDDALVARHRAQTMSALADRDPSYTADAVTSVRCAYATGADDPSYWSWASWVSNLPREVAEQIVDDAVSYPLAMVAAAENVCRSYAGAQARPMLEVAGDQDWEWR